MRKGKQALKRKQVVTGTESARSLSAPVSSLASFFEPVCVGIGVLVWKAGSFRHFLSCVIDHHSPVWSAQSQPLLTSTEFYRGR